MLLHALLAYEIHNADPVKLIQFRNRLTAKGWGLTQPSGTLSRIFAQDDRERDQKLRAEHGMAVDKESFDPDAFCGVAEDCAAIESEVRALLSETADDTGVGTWCYVLQIGTEPPRGARSVDLPRTGTGP